MELTWLKKLQTFSESTHSRKLTTIGGIWTFVQPTFSARMRQSMRSNCLWAGSI